MPRLRDEVDDWVDAIMNIFEESYDGGLEKKLEAYLREEFGIPSPPFFAVQKEKNDA